VDQFDPNIPGLIEGDITSVAVIDPPSLPFQVGNLVLDPKQAFTLEIKWKVFGAITPVWLAALDQLWDVNVYAESLGDGPEVRIGNESRDKNTFAACAGVNCREYTVTVTVPPNTLPEDDGANVSGIYKLVVSVFLNSNLGLPGFDITGFREGPIIKIEDPN
jgi:hypothetical protein